MLADHVEAQTLQELEVVHHGLPVGRCVDAIRPVALVQSAEHEDKLSVEKRTQNTVDLALGERAEPGVAVHFVVAQTNSHVVQVGRVRRPQLDVRYLEDHGLISLSGVRGNLVVAIVHRHLDRVCVSTDTVSGHIDYLIISIVVVVKYVEELKGHTLAVHVGVNVQLLDPVYWRRLNPHTLPDATAGRVEDVRGSQGLLSIGDDIIIRVSWVVHKDQTKNNDQPTVFLLREMEGILQFVFLASLDMLRNVDFKVEVPASVEAGLFTIDKHSGFIVHGSEVQQHILVLPLRRHVELGGEPGVEHFLSLNSCFIS